MNKIFMFVVLLGFGFVSCSSDDNSGDNGSKSVLTVTIDGVEKVFNTVQVQVETEYDSAVKRVSASIDNNPSEYITFRIYDADKGVGALKSFGYTDNGEYFSNNRDGSFLNSILEVHEGGKLKGTFSGELDNYNYNSTEETKKVKLTNGSFTITYKK